MEDLGSWSKRIEKGGDLKKFVNVDWNLEVGYLTACNWKKRDGPALLFDKIKGYPEGFRILTSAIQSPRRVAALLNLPPGRPDRELIQILRKKARSWEENLEAFAPTVVTNGPVLENIQAGGDVNVLQFPVPLWHEKDGGRYIGTGNAVITKDPDNGEVNLGTYRVMVHDKKTLGIHISPGRHARIHCENYQAKGKACPMLVSVGHHPLIFIVAGQQFPAGTEYSYAGAMQERPIEVITEEVTGLPMPAHAEIVLAGWCPPDKALPEGPFGEFTGYYASGVRPDPIIEVERVYYRNNPILLGSPPGRPPNETSYYNMLVHSAMLHNELEKSGVPDVTGVCTHDLRTFLITVSLKQRYAGHAKQVALLASELGLSGGIGPKYVIVVDEDVDVTDIKEVLWALLTRSDPDEDIDILRRLHSTPLDPAIRKPVKAFFQSRAIMDACKPFEWIKEFPEAIEFSPELKSRMTEKWGEEYQL